MVRVRYSIDADWRGQPIAAAERCVVEASLEAAQLRVVVDAPFHGDAPPPLPPGRCDRLWEHEVVELFLLGDDARYVEIELGPHGHHLALSLHGARRVVDAALPLQMETPLHAAGRWSATATLPRACVPEPLRAGNAYAIHGCGAERRYLAARAVRGARPDFHRLECFEPWPDRG